MVFLLVANSAQDEQHESDDGENDQDGVEHENSASITTGMFWALHSSGGLNSSTIDPENKLLWHYKTPDKDQLAAALKQLQAA